MINFDRFILDNGLRVLVHNDPSTPIATVNILYNVGAKDESSDKTGFAHLFEHLMFGGSINIPSFDQPIQNVGGENNAFTSNDITNYYINLPVQNIETAFWLESDRMLSLAFSEKSLQVQRNVVIEEFKQRYLNQPYGDVWSLIRKMAYKVHPYQWPTIGKKIEHIENASLADVKKFFFENYAPNNAILTVAGNVSVDEIKKMAEKWFGPIERRNIKERKLPQEPVQKEAQRMEVVRDVPQDSFYKVWHMCGKRDSQYHTTDLVSDLLSNGNSSRLYQNLVKRDGMFSDVHAYILGSHDPGLFVTTGKLIPGVSMDEAEDAIEKQLDEIRNGNFSDDELQKVKNKVESTFLFSHLSCQSKALSLSLNELLTEAEDLNREMDKYARVGKDEIVSIARDLLKNENSSTLQYFAEKKK